MLGFLGTFSMFFWGHHRNALWPETFCCNVSCLVPNMIDWSICRIRVYSTCLCAFNCSSSLRDIYKHGGHTQHSAQTFNRNVELSGDTWCFCFCFCLVLLLFYVVVVVVFLFWGWGKEGGVVAMS